MAEEGIAVSSKTTTNTIRTSIRKRQKSQMPIGILILAFMLGIGIYLTTISVKLGFIWLTGICFGFVLQKSRFCFTASMRDPYLTGNTSVARAVLIAFAITSVGFTVIKYGSFVKGLPIPGQNYVTPISLGTIVGAFMFGIGMVIAGGCASGTLMRVGEGFVMQVLTLFFFIIGSLLGAHGIGWLNTESIIKGILIFMPDVLGWFGAIAVQLLIIGALYILAVLWEKRSADEEV